MQHAEIDLEPLERAFREFRRKNKVGPGCKYPEEIKALARDAYEKGVPIRRLSFLCHLHTEVIKRWTLQGASGRRRLRELAIIPEEKLRPREEVRFWVILPNGIRLECPIETLTTELVHILGSAMPR